MTAPVWHRKRLYGTAKHWPAAHRQKSRSGHSNALQYYAPHRQKSIARQSMANHGTAPPGEQVNGGQSITTSCSTMPARQSIEAHGTGLHCKARIAWLSNAEQSTASPASNSPNHRLTQWIGD